MSTRKAFAIGGAAVAAAAVMALGVNTIANADTNTSTSTSTPSPGSSESNGQAPNGQRPDGDGDGPRGMRGVAGDGSQAGPGETLLTGDTAAKVKAAALEAVPGGTVVRVETDSGSAKYEAHVTTKAGTAKTVKLNADFEVVAVQDGMGQGPAGQNGPAGQRPGGQAPNGQAPSGQAPNGEAPAGTA